VRLRIARARITSRDVTGHRDLTQRLAVALLALVVFLFFGVHGLFVDRPVGAEEVVLLNPAYTYAHEGRTTFPAYGFFYGPRMYETFAVHPHTHYQMVGLGLRADLGIRVAEVLPILVTLLVAIALLAVSRLSTGIQLGFLYGIGAGLALSVEFASDETFSARPEFHIALTWFAGLVALEAGRRTGWRLPMLFFGALLLSVASGMQWFSLGAFAAVFAYGVVAVRALGFRNARMPLAAMAAGALAFGIPFLLLFVRPNWDIINIVKDLGWGSARTSVWRANFDVYANFSDLFRNAAIDGEMLWTAGPAALALATHIPPFLIAALLLFTLRETRTLAVASLPLPLWSFFASNHKAYYYVPEFLLVSAAVAAVLAMLLLGLATRVFASRGRVLASAALSVLFACALLSGSPSLREAEFDGDVLPHRMEVARAAGLRIVGDNALVASQHQLWFIAGARYWHDFFPALVSPSVVAVEPTSPNARRAPRRVREQDPRRYFAQFDAVADTPYWSFDVQALRDAPRWTIVAALYADNGLHLRGFLSDDYAYTVFQSSRPNNVRGYARRGSVMYEFVSSRVGSHVFATAVCPGARLGSARVWAAPETLARSAERVELRFAIAEVFAGPFSAVAQSKPFAPARVRIRNIPAIVSPHDRYRAWKAALPSGCRIRNEIRGRVGIVDPHDLGRSVRSEGKVVRAYYTAAEAVAAKRAATTARQAGSSGSK
jgi:hypothetical protein